MAKIAAFGVQKSLGEVLWLGILDEEIREFFLRQSEEAFIVPKRVVRVETDCPMDGGGHAASFRIAVFSRGLRRLYKALHEMTHPEKTKAMMRADFYMMSDGDKGDDDVGVKLETRTRTKRPPLYKVLILNDDYTPMEFVVHVLERFFGMNHAQAFELMLTVHKKGIAVVGVFSFEIAETKVAQVMDFAQRHQHPLQCTMEKE